MGRRMRLRLSYVLLAISIIVCALFMRVCALIAHVAAFFERLAALFAHGVVYHCVGFVMDVFGVGVNNCFERFVSFPYLFEFVFVVFLSTVFIALLLAVVD